MRPVLIYGGPMRGTRQKYAGVLTERLAICRQRLQAALERDDHAAVDILAEQGQAIERQLHELRGRDS